MESVRNNAYEKQSDGGAVSFVFGVEGKRGEFFTGVHRA
jgi:hypothetical protein